MLRRPDGAQLWWDLAAGPGGGRPVVVLCPPGGRNAAYWPPSFVSALVADGCDVLRFDWRGQGRSTWPPVPVTAEQLVDDAEALCREADVTGRPVHLVGVGLGGWVAARLSRRLAGAGRRPARLVLVGTSGWYSDPAMPGPSEPIVVALVLRRRGGGPADFVRALSREVAVEESRPGPLDGSRWLDEVAGWLEHGFNPEDGHRVAWLAAPAIWDELDGLADVVTVLHGGRDPVVPRAHADRLVAATGGRLELVPEAGHHVDDTVRARLRSLLGPPPR